MATKYYALLTNVGAAKLANATALGEQVEITQMAVGDGNGALPTPNPAQTALVHELRRAPLNTLTIDPVNTNQIIAEQVIPEDVGGWWIREIGLYDSKGDLIAIANCAETYKPLLQEGSGRMQVIRVILIVSSTQAVTLKIDPSVVLATRQYVDDQIIQVKAFVDQQLAAHIAAADPHKQYAPKASPALTGTPTAPTAAQTVNNTQIATTEFVKSAIAALVASSPAALDTLNELAAALGDDPNFATTVTNALAGKQPLDSTLTDLSGKTVNGILQYLGLGDGSGRYSKTVVFSSSGSYTWPADVKRIDVILTAAGGGGCGCNAENANQTFSGAGGGAGGTVFATIYATDNDAGPGTYTVTIGGGGSGANGPGSGNNGGNSSFMTLTALGGQGGQWRGATNTAGGRGGSGSGGYKTEQGGDGSDGQAGQALLAGNGASSYWGGGGRAGVMIGIFGVCSGSGGGGAYDNTYSHTSGRGGNGANGVLVIREHM
ncbi:TPA: phage tail protein [Enterobacter hormaechei subsp. hoffmannii]|nr:phage tail protein [Enterobacter hormaechei subsp. hoffmannii]HED2690244.1 phage tail protein [Enterobacter hormaechei subsp. hoffmannii]HED2772445.1 phage tail protein [Enterobacter hormaechei subsp. hoffmannii]HED4154775.1 phage tail protein [Enterobacter hormaechei subsp. hoffmannii]HED4164524.1 phage tail protein [Enterobacter hormaechei subsp. hoffmannii]